MSQLPSIHSQIHKNLFPLALIFAISSALMGLVIVLNIWKNVPPWYLLGDPVVVLGGSFHAGMVSQFGIFMWATASAICLFAGYIVKHHGENPKLGNFLVASGFLSLWLGFDDVFMIHDEILPDFTEKIVYSAYVAITLSHLIYFKSIIRRTNYLLLTISFVFFALSIGIDQVPLPGLDLIFWEDGAKVVGLSAWLVYWVQTSALSIDNMLLKHSKMPYVALPHMNLK